MKDKNSNFMQKLTLDAMLTAILVILGMIKLPSLFADLEFQLSAPYAVCLAAAVGFKRYLGSAIFASLIQLALGTHTIWNVLIAMVFRVVAGMIFTAVAVLLLNSIFQKFLYMPFKYQHK